MINTFKEVNTVNNTPNLPKSEKHPFKKMLRGTFPYDTYFLLQNVT